MRPPLMSTKSVVSVCISLSLLASLRSSPAANLTTTNIVASGNSWSSSPSIWKTNSTGMATNNGAFVQIPVIQNTYETVQATTNTIGNGLNNTRIRNPASAGVQTFPGASLTMYTNTELRAKTAGAILNFPGVGGNT